MVGDENNIILDCYRLARWYHQSPDHFLDMPVSVMRKHMARTAELSRAMRAAADSEE